MKQRSQINLQRVRRLVPIARALTMLLLVAMFLGTHLPVEVQTGQAHSDKAIHFVAYMVLAMALLGTWELSTGWLQPQHFFIVWLGCTVYAAFDEVTQIPVGRSCDGIDWLADVVGVVAGLTLYQLMRPLAYRLMLTTTEAPPAHQ